MPTVTKKAPPKAGKKPAAAKAPAKAKATPKPAEKAKPNKAKAQPAKPVSTGPVKRVRSPEDVQLDRILNLCTRAAKAISEAAGPEFARQLDVKRPASELAHVYGAVRDGIEILAGATKPFSEAKFRMESELIPQAFERENLSSFTTLDGYRVTLSTRFMASIIQEVKPQAYQWLRDHELGELITETVNASTLSAAGKAMIEEKGKELPEEFFKTYYAPGVSLTKVKKK